MVQLPYPPKGTKVESVSIVPSRRERYYRPDGTLYQDSVAKGSSSNIYYSRADFRSTNPARIIGGDPMNPQWWRDPSRLLRTGWLVDYGEGTISVLYNNGYRRQYDGQAILGSQAFFGPFVDAYQAPKAPGSNIRNRLDTELLMKIGARKASYGESLGEMRQTANHLAGSVSSLVKGVLLARKGRWAQAAEAWGASPRSFKTSKGWASKWLSHQYAWMPLMGDIYDTYDLLNKGFREKKLLASSVRVLRDYHTASDKDIVFNRTSKVWGNSSVHYKAKVYYSVSDSSLSRFNQLGLVNPYEVAWAITPYSFVVDWFLPVGNVLEALTAPFGVDFIAGYYSQKVDGTYTTQPYQAASSGKVLSNSVETRTEISSYARQVMGSFPLPGLYWKSPFSTKHVLSALALVRQLIR